MYHSSNVRQGPGSIELPRSRAPVVKADALLYVHFERPDLNQARDYLVDFGLLVVSQSEGELFLRGAGSKPYIYRVSRGPAARFIGFGLSVPSAEDLKALAKASGRSVETVDGGRAAAPSSAWSTRWGSRSASITASPRLRRSRFARPFPTMPRTRRFASTTPSVQRWRRRR